MSHILFLQLCASINSLFLFLSAQRTDDTCPCSREAMAPIIITYKRRRSEMLKMMVNEQVKALTIRPTSHAKRRRVADSVDSDVPSLLELLPPELFCHILSFVGPASTTLLALAQVNEFFRGTMNAIGNAMLPRAQAHFRVSLPPKSPIESKTSLFIRHARICNHILNQLTKLRTMLQATPTENDADQVQRAMDMSFALLNIGPSLSLSLERQILSTCGKCGGMAYKYCKWMRSHCAAASSDNKEVGPRLEQERQLLCVQNQARMDKAQSIMQMVVFRDLQLSKEYDDTPSLLTRSSVSKASWVLGN